MSVNTSWPELVPQRIRSWGGWPDDVRPTIERWNRSKGLSFGYGAASRVNGIPYFKCDGCERFIQVRAADRCVFRGQTYCEDCLIGLARAAVCARGETE